MKNEILEITTRIPYGRVTSYGQVAQMLDTHFSIHTSGRMVGRVLSGMNAEEQLLYPWRRVLNKQGYISSLKLGERGLRQKILLQKEHIEIQNDTVNMAEYGRKK